jgi:hypothetical protein
MSNRVFIDLSYRQHSPLGKALFNLYYRNKSLCDMAPDRGGYPHNGGEHTFTIKGERGECLAFLDLMVDTYPEAAELLNAVIAQVNFGKDCVSVRNVESMHHAA